ncbi:hypothetical protein K435DRAFT_896091 [Dendrothele bispora CBS 962.96]|uniref:Uncharacterized protein n=1 Tax=Dendrothele bispora (strain CBS 962.96) TaxID=1314807 RepID=A0A4S8M0J5_DENBC|nr:hypothetical protein K435DRAFT_896091 [Dendrothele bispora CBS 962.96]
MCPSSLSEYRKLAELMPNRGRRELDRMRLLSLAEGWKCTWGEVTRGVPLRFPVCVLPEFMTFPLRVPGLELRVVVVVVGGGDNTSMMSRGVNGFRNNLRGGGRLRIDCVRLRRRGEREEEGEKELLRGESASDNPFPALICVCAGTSDAAGDWTVIRYCRNWKRWVLATWPARDDTEDM